MVALGFTLFEDTILGTHQCSFLLGCDAFLNSVSSYLILKDELAWTLNWQIDLSCKSSRQITLRNGQAYIFVCTTVTYPSHINLVSTKIFRACFSPRMHDMSASTLKNGQAYVSAWTTVTYPSPINLVSTKMLRTCFIPRMHDTYASTNICYFFYFLKFYANYLIKISIMACLLFLKMFPIVY